MPDVYKIFTPFYLLFILMESPTTLSFLSAIGHICLFDFILKLAKEDPKGS